MLCDFCSASTKPRNQYSRHRISAIMEIAIESENAQSAATVGYSYIDDDEDVQVSADRDPVRDKFKDIMEQAFHLTKSFSQEGNAGSPQQRKNSGTPASENGRPSNRKVSFNAGTPISDSGHGVTTEDSREAQRSFIKDRKKDITQLARGNENILHFLAKDDGNLVRNGIRLVWVALRIMAYYPELMGQADDQGRMPLSLAIIERNDRFIRAVSDVGTSYWEEIRKELEKEYGPPSTTSSGTCLHLAMISAISPQSRKTIIDRAPVEMIHMLNSSGLTPLHLAVEFKRCTPEQVNVVERLLGHELALKALVKKTDIPHSPDKNHLSAYQYHEYTRRISQDNGEGRSSTSADKIQEMLKLNYLRKLDPGPASRCLRLPGESCTS